MHVTIRPATEADIPTIISLIYELALYEREPEAAQATPELIKRNVFEQKYANCILAEGDVQGETKAVGLAIYFFSL